jgi:formylglycine-generating enzyme required for sulfatase activity
VMTYMVGKPLPTPGADVAVNLVTLGGDPTGERDSAPAFNKACEKAVAKGLMVWIPPGRFEMGEQITLIDHVVVRGAGAWSSELHWTDPNSSGLKGKASPGSANVHL